MASLVVRRVALFSPSSYPGCIRRAIHFTPVGEWSSITIKKGTESYFAAQKKKAAVEIEDLFSDSVEEDLIPSQPAATSKKSAKTSANTTASAKVAPKASSSKVTPALKFTPPVAKTVIKSKKLSAKSRVARFNGIVEFVIPRLGRKPAVKMPMVRGSAWVHLVGLATTEQQLKTVVGMFPGWKEAGNTFDDAFSELFVRRCEELKCPLLALKVYGEFAKYNVPLSLVAGRQLLHSLHTKHPLETVMTAAALYDVYQLPAVSEDLVSASLVASACFKHNTKDSMNVANVIVPQIQTLLKTAHPHQLGIRAQKKKAAPVMFAEKPSVWMKWAIGKIDKAVLAQTERPLGLTHLWRRSTGYGNNNALVKL
ncbi:hypothetical protein DXG01_004362 [Tephrocybe rancida]|nr:hypothetical protein DXG01_004362 [Tephrocybe rancida]